MTQQDEQTDHVADGAPSSVMQRANGTQPEIEQRPTPPTPPETEKTIQPGGAIAAAAPKVQQPATSDSDAGKVVMELPVDSHTPTAAVIVTGGSSSSGLPTDIEQRVNNVRTKLAAASLDQPGQVELARLAHVLDDILAQKMYRLVGDVELAAALLTAKQVGGAAAIRKNLESGLGRLTPIGILRRNSAPTNVVLGMITLLIGAAALLTFLVLPNVKPGTTIADMDPTLLILVTVAGALGSIVSMMYRIDQFRDGSSSTSILFFFTGLFKPIIGIGSALFVYAILAAKLLAFVQPDARTQSYFYAALAFVAGFAEHLAPDLIDKASHALEASTMGGSPQGSDRAAAVVTK